MFRLSFIFYLSFWFGSAAAGDCDTKCANAYKSVSSDVEADNEDGTCRCKGTFSVDFGGFQHDVSWEKMDIGDPATCILFGEVSFCEVYF